MSIEKVIIGAAELYLGDCREVLEQLEAVDHVITDPPYGEQTHEGARTRVGANGTADNVKSIDFDHVTAEQFIADVDRMVELARRWCILTCEWRYIAAIEAARDYFVRFGVWVKPNGAPQFTGDRPATGWEAVLICHRTDERKRWNGGGTRAVWTVPTESGHHKTQKPLALLSRWIEDFTDVGELVLDPFMGSGSTGVAALSKGRRFIGIEQDPEHFETACWRIERAPQPQLDLFPRAEVKKSVQDSLL
jgi:site-specific DNA-methyltransferase (adenine-specific)